MTQDIRIAVTDEKILEIVLDRPGEGNVLTPAMTEAIASALGSLAPDISAVLLRAEGPDFCTGRAASMPAPGTRVTALDMRALISDPVLEFYDLLRRVPVPLVMAVGGKAAGVGCALVALADIAVASPQARFQVPEMARDIAPTLVMDALADRLQRAALARLVLTRDEIGADEALAIGLIGKVADDPAAEAARIVKLLAANSPAPLRAVKAFLSRAPETSFAARRELAALLNSIAASERYR